MVIGMDQNIIEPPSTSLCCTSSRTRRGLTIGFWPRSESLSWPRWSAVGRSRLGLDDTGLPHSVGVARQYCGQLGKQDNCQVAVSLSLASETASLPIAGKTQSV